MVKVQRNVPDYYYDESRDFQLIGRIFESVLNHSKTATDIIVNTPLSQNYDVSLIDLVTLTIGFESKRKYDVPNLMALISSFKSILKIKGTKKSIEDCVRVLLKAQNINEDFQVVVDTSTSEVGEETIYNRDVLIYIPKEVKDVALLEDMLDYVLPAGFNYSIIIAVIEGQTVGAEAVSVDTVDSTEPYLSEEIGIITPGLVTLDENELNNADKGVVDNTVIVWPDIN
jgi:hypothetical protein